MNKLQSILLMILSDVDQLLKHHQIKYFLDGGSALGAIRHKGFIPWDDDLDIVIMPEDYEKFVYVCKNYLDKNKYSFEEAEIDWPLPFSKIKLNGTIIDEIDAFPSDHRGIYIDIFTMDYARKSTLGKIWQVITGRIYTACFLSLKPYSTHNRVKQVFMAVARSITKSKTLFTWLRNQVRGQKPSEYFSLTWDRTRSNWKDYFVKRECFHSAVEVDFENRKFPICKGYDEYLTHLYGDYMKLPPEDKRVQIHIKSIDYGKYEDTVNTLCKGR